MTSLRSDISFIARTLGSAIRRILGETFRIIADTLLYQKQEPMEAPPAPVATPTQAPTQAFVRVKPKRNSIKSVKAAQKVTSIDPPPEVDEPVKPPKVRNRSGYLAKEHGAYKIAAIAILKVFLYNQEAGPRLSVPELYKILDNTSTDSTIRTACKTMVEDQIFDTIHEDGARSAVYWVKDEVAARNHLAYLESVTPKLPTSEEGGEPEASLN
jgi:hypothetical protein